MKRFHSCNYIYIPFIIGILSLFIWTLSTSPVSTPLAKTSYSTMNTGWYQIMNDTSIFIDDIENIRYSDEMDTLVLECELPEIPEGYVLVYYTRYLENHGYVNGDCIHSFEIDDNFSILGTPGSAWNLIELTPEMNGATLRLEFDMEFYNTVSGLYDIYLIKETSVETLRLGELGLYIIAVVFMFCVTLFAFFYSLIWHKYKVQYFSLITQLYLFYTLWLLSELNFFDIFTKRPILSYLLSMAIIRIIPFTFYRIIVKDKNVFPRLQIIWGVLNISNLFIPWILQFLFRISLIDTLWINQATFFANMALYLLIIVKIYGKVLHKNMSEYPFLFLGCVFIGSILDHIIYSEQVLKVVTFNIFSVIGFFSYSIVAFISFTYSNSTTVVEKQQLEKSYQKLEISSLMQQIKSHFIFNALNTISALCKVNATKADHATKLFANYLRSYMYLINQHEAIPFENEIELVQKYLEIEKLRFESSISFEINIEYEEFAIPPLTLQPVVENAVIHGIRGHALNGHIFIHAIKHDNIVIITVQDNGVGFDTTTTNPWNSIGLSNIRKRLEVMSSGTITLESTPHHGTTVKITVPLS